MNFELWLAYVGTVMLLMSTPGPSHLLMLSVSLSNGFHRSLATAAGDLTANVIQMLLAGFGLAAILMTSQYGFTILKWLGIAYLVWLGLRQILASFNGVVRQERAQRSSLTGLWARGFVTSAANPKAVVFFAALFPQFIRTEYHLPTQLAILGTTYVLIDGVFLTAYGKGASWIAIRTSGKTRVWIDRASGAALIVAAMLLGLKSTQQS